MKFKIERIGDKVAVTIAGTSGLEHFLTLDAEEACDFGFQLYTTAFEVMEDESRDEAHHANLFDALGLRREGTEIH